MNYEIDDLVCLGYTILGGILWAVIALIEVQNKGLKMFEIVFVIIVATVVLSGILEYLDISIF